MVDLITQKERRKVRDLAFCYLCGLEFAPQDDVNYDHVPPQSAFKVEDRDPLKLPTHKKCNHENHIVDEKVGQLIALRRRDLERPPTNLRFRKTNIGTALWNLDVDAAVWRWISGFHAALYREPLKFARTGLSDPPFVRSLVVPFPKASKEKRRLDPLLPQHLKFVETIKINRFLGNLDRIHCNRGQLRYECTWSRYDGSNSWFCAFALDVSDWKDLGALTPSMARGCAGHYMTEDRIHPIHASISRSSGLILPNYDKADPFSP